MPFATENAIQAAQLDIIEEALLDLDAPSALLSILADLRLEKGFEQPQSIGEHVACFLSTNFSYLKLLPYSHGANPRIYCPPVRSLCI